jgi:tetratricopeptide (TPR) repeat protein
VTPAAARWTPVLERTAAFLGLFGFLLRLWAGGATSGSGLNLFIHLLPWLALALWFGARALEGGALWRFTGAEFALLAFAIASLGAALGASYRAPALEHAFAFLSLGLLLLFAIQALGAATLLSLLVPTLLALGLYALLQYAVLLPEVLRSQDFSRFGELSVEMLRRARAREVWATFHGPNQFAAVLVLLLPPAAGVLLDRRKGGPAGWVPPAAALALGGTCLALTGSLGGGVALAAGAAAFAALALTRERGRGLAVAAGGAAAALALLLVLFTPLLEHLAARSHALHVRRVYWQAAGRVVRESPFRGVGLDNFQEHYFRLKSDVPQETTKVHNDYLQLLAETGIPGLLAFGALLAVVLRRGLARQAPAPLPPEPHPRWLVPAAAAASLLAAWLLARAFDPVLAAVLAAAWLGAFLAGRRAPPGGAPPVFARIGAAAGLVALLVHLTVDFDLYDFGVAAAFAAALALAALLGPPPAEARLPRGACAAAAGLLLLVAGPLLVGVVPRALAADQEVAAARLALRALESARGTEQSALRLLQDALRLSQAAQEHHPLSTEGYELHARARLHEWEHLRATARDEGRMAEAEGIALASLENAIALRPRHAPAHHRKAALHRRFRRHAIEESARPERRTFARAQAEEHLRKALGHERRAVELYPTHPESRYALARLLEESGEREEAGRHYAEALRLSDRAGRELEDLDRLKLAPWERVRALRRLDRPAEALEAARAWLSGRPSDDLRRLRARPALLGVPPEELDEVLRPVIEEAIDAILK